MASAPTYLNIPHDVNCKGDLADPEDLSNCHKARYVQPNVNKYGIRDIWLKNAKCLLDMLAQERRSHMNVLCYAVHMADKCFPPINKGQICLTVLLRHQNKKKLFLNLSLFSKVTGSDVLEIFSPSAC